MDGMNIRDGIPHTSHDFFGVSSQPGDDWPVLVDFQRDAVLNFNFAKQHSSNPFQEPQYTFQV